MLHALFCKGSNGQREAYIAISMGSAGGLQVYLCSNKNTALKQVGGGEKTFFLNHLDPKITLQSWVCFLKHLVCHIGITVGSEQGGG